MNKPLNMMDVIRAGAEKTCTPCLLLPNDRTEAEARAEIAAKALEAARNDPYPSCRWSRQHLTSSKGNFCSLCGTEMPTPHFYPSSAEVIDHPAKAEQEIAYAWSRL